MTAQAAGLDIIVLAGSRPGPDPLRDAYGVATKALIPIAGEPMLSRTLRPLLARGDVGRVTVLAQQLDILRADPGLGWAVADPRMRFAGSGAGISQSLLDLQAAGEMRFPTILTTADNVLLSGAMLDALVAGARGHDLAVAMVERRVLRARYPESRRTWLRFAGGAWSGANLFWLGSERALEAVRLWRGIEQDRKKGRRVIGAFGPLLLALAMLRVMSLPCALAWAGRRLGLDAVLVPLAEAEACIDADKPEDIALIERILAA